MACNRDFRCMNSQVGASDLDSDKFECLLVLSDFVSSELESGRVLAGILRASTSRQQALKVESNLNDTPGTVSGLDSSWNQY